MEGMPLTCVEVVRVGDELVHEGCHFELALLLLGLMLLPHLVAIGDVLLKELGQDCVHDLQVE